MNFRSQVLFVTFFTFSSTLWAHSGATGIVKERMDNFKESKKSMKLLKKAVRNDDFTVVAQEAMAINQWARRLTDYFPEGSNQPPSEALNLIWEEFERFEVRAETQIKASERLQRSGLNKDADGAAKAYSELAQSCKACHNDYRE